MRRFLARRISKWFLGNAAAPGAAQDQFTCGTLHYTPAALAVLFGWLLWGDFTMTVMESMPLLLGMQLKDYALSNTIITILMVSIPTLSNMALSPVISYTSDRYRSRWGRRRPFLMVFTPFAALFLILIPWAPEITTAALKLGWIRFILGLFPAAPIVLMFGVLILGYSVFNIFINTTYCYLLPDTVPEPVYGRFCGLFRVFGTLAVLLYNFLLFGYAHAHMRLLFAIFAGIYAVSFMLMGWKVREGEYPEIQEEHGCWYSPIKNYFGECFGHLRNWLMFLVYGSVCWASAANVFSLYFYRDQIGLTEKEIGWLAGTASAATLLLSVPFGVIIDRIGSQKSLMIGMSAGVVISLICFLGIHSRPTAFILGFLMNVPVFLAFLAMGKWLVDMYPRAQYGQFASAGAIVGAAGSALLSPLIGKLVDVLGNYYRLCLIVPGICYALCIVFSLILYHWPKPETPESQLPIPEDAPGEGS
jgi:MFS family permease